MRLRAYLLSSSVYFSRRGANYSQFVPEGVLANSLGVAVALATVVITYVVNNSAFVRRPLAND